MMILIVFRDAGHSMYQIHKPEEDPYPPSIANECDGMTQDNLNAVLLISRRLRRYT